MKLVKAPQSDQRNLSAEQIKDLKLAASKMVGAKRRAFIAQMTTNYCQGSARKAERAFGWKRTMVELGLAEQRSGIECLGAQAGRSGSKRWEEQQPETAKTLVEIAEAHGQQDPSFKTTISYTRLTAAQAIEELKQRGYGANQLPAPSTMTVILNRMGYRLRPVMKAKPQKKFQPPMQFS